MNRRAINQWAASASSHLSNSSERSFSRLWIVVLLGIIITALLGSCSSGLQKASVEMMDKAEARWQQQPALDYEIMVEVNRPGDRRRSTVIVQRGQIVRGDVSYWNAKTNRWDEPSALNQEQSFPFTVPGLFDMVRGELENSGRADIRVKQEGEPPFPRRIVLGPVMLDGQAMSGTEAVVTVERYGPR